jgi:diguanylate cyclase
LLSFNLLPALVLLTMTSLGGVMVGGRRRFLRGLLAAAVGLSLSWVVIVLVWSGYRIQLEPSLLTLIAVAPLMVGFPLSVGVISYGWSRDLALQRNELEKISRTDELSKLNNRQFWEASAYTEYERHRRSDSPLSLMLIDIDHFNELNEKYGQVAGDQIIRDLAELISESIREADIVCRYGGEKFAMLLPDTDLKGAMLFAERLRISVQTLLVKPYDISCTVSLGVATAGGDVQKYQQLVEHADLALVQAKSSGRNIVAEYNAD